MTISRIMVALGAKYNAAIILLNPKLASTRDGKKTPNKKDGGKSLAEKKRWRLIRNSYERQMKGNTCDRKKTDGL